MRATSALWIRIFDGMHPRFKHVPPIGPGSINATRFFSSDAAELTFNPEPPPITMTSNVSIGETEITVLYISCFGGSLSAQLRQIAVLSALGMFFAVLALSANLL